MTGEAAPRWTEIHQSVRVTGFGALPETLRAAGSAAASAVDALGGGDCGDPVRAASSALPGSSAGPSAVDYATGWSGMFQQWRGRAHEHAGALAQAAATYADTEAANHARLGPSRRPSRGAM
jgi:hypothetical protein